VKVPIVQEEDLDKRGLLAFKKMGLVGKWNLYRVIAWYGKKAPSC
jgi:hypothetical protein